MDEENALRLDIQNFLIVTAKSFLPNALVDEVFQLARNVVTKTTRKGSADFTCKAFVSLFATLKRIATMEREGEEKEEENESAIREALLKSWKASKNEISTTTTTATTTDNDDDDESKEDERNAAKEKTAVLGENYHLCYRRKADESDGKNITLVLYRVTSYGLIQRSEYADSIALCEAVYENMDASQIHKIGIADIRTCPKGGTMRILTKKRLAEHAKMGELMCSMCGRFFEASKGLVTHTQSVHKHSYEESKNLQQTSRNSLIDLTNIDALQREYLLSRFTEVLDQEEAKKKAAPELHPLLEICKTNNVENARQFLRENPDADVNDICDQHGSNCLHWSSGSNALELCKFLCDEVGMDPAFAERKKGRAAIHWASRNGCLEVLVWLIEEKGIDKDCEMSDGTTPFMRAAWMGHLELCEYLVKVANCDIHRENKYRCNAVHWAAQSGDVKMLKYLRALGLDVTSANVNGHSILHKSATKGFYDACVYLVEELDLPLLRDNDGYGPEDMAKMEGHKELASWLKDRRSRIE